MPLKATGLSADFEEVDRWDDGVGWIAHPEETLQRAGHALTSGDDVWVIDPVDAPGVDDLFAEFGTVTGVVVTLHRHTRDAAQIAARHGVRVYIPKWVAGGTDVPGPVTIFDGRLPGTNIEALKVADRPGWHEAALYDPGERTLYVSEALGSADYMTAGDERVGVHPMLRLFPPTSLGEYEPDRILFGHGRGVFDGAVPALHDALTNSRRGSPRLVGKMIRRLLSG